MKKINEEQIKTIISAFYQINAPVQVYAGIKDMLDKLPDVTTETKSTE